MPRVIAFKLRWRWVAFTLNDYNEVQDGAAGWSETAARRRCLALHTARFE